MIEFIQDHRVRPYGPDYKKGERFTGKPASENHFLRKGVAVSVETPKAEPAEEKKPVEEVLAEAQAEQESAIAELVEISSVSPQDPASPQPTARPRGRLSRKS